MFCFLPAFYLVISSFSVETTGAENSHAFGCRGQYQHFAGVGLIIGLVCVLSKKMWKELGLRACIPRLIRLNVLWNVTGRTS